MGILADHYMPPKKPNALVKYLQNPQPLQRTGEGNYLRQQFPKVYGALGGLLGTAPDEMQGSLLDPLTADVRKGAEIGYLPGLIMGGAPPIKGAAGLGALAGMFVGKGSKTWDAVQASRALELEKAGVDARKIWSETGTWKAPDGAWRQEIPDNEADFHSFFKQPTNEQYQARQSADKFNANIDAERAKAKLEKDYSIPKFWEGRRDAYDQYFSNKRLIGEYDNLINPLPKRGPLGQFYEHDPLAKAYPEIDDIPTTHDMRNSGGSYTPGMNTMLIGGGAEKSITAHEVQHIIQGREGWAKGGSPDAMKGEIADKKSLLDKYTYAQEQYNTTADPIAKSNALQQMEFYKSKYMDSNIPNDPVKAYMNLAGEAEARATQARIPLDAAARRGLFPADSYDVPLDQLIIRRDGNRGNSLQSLAK